MDLAVFCYMQSISVNTGEQNKYSVNLYPIPFRDELFITVEVPVVTGININLVDLTGNVVKYIASDRFCFKKLKVNVNTQDLPNGIYFCVVSSPAGSKVRKIVKTE